jgi:hypothetical protein
MAVPRRIPETRPTPLEGVFIPLSVVALVCGAVAISAFELGTPLGAPLVRLPLLVAAVLLVAVEADALVRVWRSARAWLPVERGRGLARFLWSGVILLGLCASLAAVWLAIVAPG